MVMIMVMQSTQTHKLLHYGCSFRFITTRK